MYRAITNTPHTYTGFSRKMAFEFARACLRSGRNVCMWKRYSDGTWRSVLDV